VVVTLIQSPLKQILLDDDEVEVADEFEVDENCQYVLTVN